MMEGKHVALAAKVQFCGPKARPRQCRHYCIECAFLPDVRAAEHVCPYLDDILASEEGLSGCCDDCKTWAKTYLEEKMPKLLRILDGSHIDSSGYSGCSLDQAATSGTSSGISSGTSSSTWGEPRRFLPPPPPAPTGAAMAALAVAPPPPNLETEQIKEVQAQLAAAVLTLKEDQEDLKRKKEELMSEVKKDHDEFKEQQGEVQKQHEEFKVDIKAQHVLFKVQVHEQQEEFKVLLGSTVHCQQEEFKADLKVQHDEFQADITAQHDQFQEQNDELMGDLHAECKELKEKQEELKQEQDGLKAKHAELETCVQTADGIKVEQEQLKAEHEELQATHEGLQKSMFDMKRRVAAQYKKRPPTWGSIELYKDKEEPKPTAAEEVGPPYSSAGDQMERCDVDGFEMVATTSRSATEQSE